MEVYYWHLLLETGDFADIAAICTDKIQGCNQVESKVGVKRKEEVSNQCAMDTMPERRFRNAVPLVHR